VGVELVDLHQERPPIGLLARDQRRSRPAEQVQDVLARPAKILERAWRSMREGLRGLKNRLGYFGGQSHDGGGEVF
jgi:hypothetical protein